MPETEAVRAANDSHASIESARSALTVAQGIEAETAWEQAAGASPIPVQ